jgi:hypothetical protein
VHHEFLHAAIDRNPKLKERLLGARSELRAILRQVEAGRFRGRYRDLYEAALSRVDRTGVSGQEKLEEFLTYSVSQYVEDPKNLPERLARIVKDIIAAVKVALFKVTGRIGGLTPADLTALARDAMRYDESGGSGHGVSFSASAMKSVEANVRRGKAAMNKALLHQATVHRAMFRAGMGWVDFVWGDEGNAADARGRRKGAKGLSHILEARQRKDSLTDAQAKRLLLDLVEVIGRGEEFSRNELEISTRVGLRYDGHIVWLSRAKGSNSWMVTGYKEDPDARTAGRATRAPTQSAASLTRDGLGAGITAPDAEATHQDTSESGSPVGAGSINKIPDSEESSSGPRFSLRDNLDSAKDFLTGRDRTVNTLSDLDKVLATGKMPREKLDAQYLLDKAGHPAGGFVQAVRRMDAAIARSSSGRPVDSRQGSGQTAHIRHRKRGDGPIHQALGRGHRPGAKGYEIRLPGRARADGPLAVGPVRHREEQGLSQERPGRGE